MASQTVLPFFFAGAIGLVVAVAAGTVAIRGRRTAAVGARGPGAAMGKVAVTAGLIIMAGLGLFLAFLLLLAFGLRNSKFC